jgi:two-component system, chemotaxis family, protein-glutamate methylesterase/glutaminase
MGLVRMTVHSSTGEPPSHFAGAFDVVAIVASAGGLSALIKILAELPPDFPAAIALVQHLDPRHRSLMADILGRRSGLRAKQAEDGEKLDPGTIYLAPPDFHLLVDPDGTLSLSQSALVHFVRPSGDLLFESLAASYMDRVIAIVLTGTGSDGSMGVRAVKQMGGTVIVQDPETAEFPGMPQAAIREGVADFVLSLDEIAPALCRLVIKGEV